SSCRPHPPPAGYGSFLQSCIVFLSLSGSFLRGPDQLFKWTSSRNLDQVILSLLTLYSWIVRGISAGETQLNLFMFDSLVDEFESLIDTIAQSNPYFNVEKFYRFEDLVQVVGAAKVGRFVRIKDHDEYRLPFDILVRDSFSEKIGCNNSF
ncbi:MAG: hypothetical protein AAGI48_13900, partial [Verrucomicrobiota bacterium]